MNYVKDGLDMKNALKTDGWKIYTPTKIFKIRYCEKKTQMRAFQNSMSSWQHTKYVKQQTAYTILFAANTEFITTLLKDKNSWNVIGLVFLSRSLN